MRLAGNFRSPIDMTGLWSRQLAIALILAVALLAFEMFNFDTTQYALRNLLGEVAFLSLPWATILAVAFCAIDFAGLVRFFSPAEAGNEPREVWYLMGAWLLGATMNALMTWWAISLTLLNHSFGNEVLSRGDLLRIVPIFVALLVWLTRILFIGGLTLAGGHWLGFGDRQGGRAAKPRSATALPAARARLRQDRPGRLAPEPTGRSAAAEPAAAPEPVTARISRTPRGTTRPGKPAAPRRSPSAGRQRPPVPPIGRRMPLKAGSRRRD